MTITPFFTGLPTALPANPALAGDAGTGAAGDGGAGSGATPFGDALAAALLATLPVSTPAVPMAGAAVTDADAPADGGQTPVLAALSSIPPALVAGSVAPAPDVEEVAQQPSRDAAPRAVEEVAPQPSRDTAPRAVEEVAQQPSRDVAATQTISPTSAAVSPRTVEKAVIQQVFPEVTRIVASTSPEQVARTGTQRITLTLQPEQLGEVRVTLTVKDGAIQVRLAGNANDVVGSTAVHRALSSGIPELQRLLEHAGASEARVFVRDPASASQPATPTPAPSAQGFAALTADAGRDGASAWGRQSESAGQSGSGLGSGPGSGQADGGRDGSGRSHHARREREPALGVPDLSASTTRPAGQLDRTL